MDIFDAFTIIRSIHRIIDDVSAVTDSNGVSAIVVRRRFRRGVDVDIEGVVAARRSRAAVNHDVVGSGRAVINHGREIAVGIAIIVSEIASIAQAALRVAFQPEVVIPPVRRIFECEGEVSLAGQGHLVYDVRTTIAIIVIVRAAIFRIAVRERFRHDNRIGANVTHRRKNIWLAGQPHVVIA